MKIVIIFMFLLFSSICISAKSQANPTNASITASIIVTGASLRAGLPPGFHLLKSSDGKWKWGQGDGLISYYSSMQTFDSRKQAIYNAWEQYHYKQQEEARTWQIINQ